MPKAAAAKKKAAIVHHQIVSISVQLGVTTPDNLRHIEFDLEKDTGDDGTISWTIAFKLQERESASDDFVDVVSLTVKVKEKNNDAAEATATNGLTSAQQTHLQGPAAAAAEGVNDGSVTNDQASRVVERTLALQNS